MTSSVSASAAHFSSAYGFPSILTCSNLLWRHYLGKTCSSTHEAIWKSGIEAWDCIPNFWANHKQQVPAQSWSLPYSTAPKATLSHNLNLHVRNKTKEAQKHETSLHHRNGPHFRLQEPSPLAPGRASGPCSMGGSCFCTVKSCGESENISCHHLPNYGRESRITSW